MKRSLASQSKCPTLEKPSDWVAWDHYFQNKAAGLKLWNTIKDPMKNFLTEPVDPGTEPEVEGIQTRSQGTQDTAYVSAIQILKFKRDKYRVELSNYETQIGNIQKLKDWVLETVVDRYRRSDCQPDGTIRDWYENLKKHVAPAKTKILQDASAQYTDVITHKEGPPKGAQEWERWLEKWETVMTEGQGAEVPQCTKVPTWFSEFQRAVEPYVPGWMVSYKIAKADAVEKEELDFRTVARDFREHLSVHKGRHKGWSIAKGAFAATFADLPLEEDEGDALISDRSAVQSRSKSTAHSKRPRSDTGASSDLKCLACGNHGHDLAHCFYVFPDQAPGEWKGSRMVRKKVEKELKKEDLQEALKKIKKKKLRTEVKESHDEESQA